MVIIFIVGVKYPNPKTQNPNTPFKQIYIL
jgi:hypothetical protein